LNVGTSLDTPLRPDDFFLSDDEKIQFILRHFKEIMETLGLDLTDESLQGPPQRVAKMFTKEIFKGLNPANRPSVSLFENKYQYNKMLIENDITVMSTCCPS